MQAYLVLRASLLEPKLRARYPKILKDFNGVKLHRGLWKLPVTDLERVISLFPEEALFAFKASRSVRKGRIDEASGVYDLGSLILIAYTLPSLDTNVRKTVSRLLERAPCFRLTPSIYTFPQLNYSKYEKLYVSLVFPSKFVRTLIELNCRFTCIPKLILVDPTLAKHLIEELKRRLYSRLSKLPLYEDFEFGLSGKAASEFKVKVKVYEELLLFYKRVFNLNLDAEPLEGLRETSPGRA